MNFTSQLWEKTYPIYQKILQHPFNAELMQGTLDTDKFRHYIYQDSLYLVSFGKALAIAASKAYTSRFMNDFLRFASDSIVVENVLHETYFKLFQIKSTGQMSPACFMYTNYLISVCSTASLEESTAALLPCFWIYREVGFEIAKQAKRDNPYIDWIDTYSGKEFAEAVNRMLEITNELAADASEKVKERMLEKYTRAAKLEYMFWDSAYKLEKWGI
jgi:thiaminase (transcriptional activator TenA)